MMGNFSADIAKFANKTNSTLSEASRAIKISLFSGVIRDTRYDTGRLRGNWQTSTGNPKYAEIDRADPNGTAATQEVIENVTAFGVDYMTNNLPYAEVWEERDGMVARNMARIERIVKEAASSAKS
jgi:hypothetical protein